MFKRIIKILFRPAEFVAAMPSYLMIAGDDRTVAASTATFRRCWFGLLLMSLAWGIGQMMLWSVAWIIFPEPVHKLAYIPLLVAFVMTFWPMQQSIVGACRIFGGGNVASGRASAIVLAGIVALLMSLPHRFMLQEFPIHHYLRWIRPDFETYRVLLLMPLWGWWAMIFTCKFNRRTDRTDQATRQMSGGYGPAVGTLTLAIPMLATAINFSYLYWMHLVISFVTAIAAIIGGTVFCRKSGGLTRDAVLATNLVAQMTFLLTLSCCAR